MLVTQRKQELPHEDTRIEQVNMVFLATVLVFMGASYLLEYLQQAMQVTFPTFVRLIYSQVILILPAAIYIRMNGIKLMGFVRVKKVSFVSVIVLILLGIFLRPVMSLLSAVSMLWVENQIGDTANQLMSEVNFFLALIFIAFIPAILEEFVYRGVFYNEYRKVNTWKAILLSGLLFGLMHMNLNQFVYAFFMGVIFALIIEATDSILASMIVHFTINGGSLLLLKITPWIEEQAGIASSETLIDSTAVSRADILSMLPSMILPAIICLLISAFLYYILASHNGRLGDIKAIFHMNKDVGMQDRFATTPLVVALIICIVFMIVNAFA